MIKFFGCNNRKYGWLSNFYECNIEYVGCDFTCSEQLFMWFKAVEFEDVEMANKILKTDYNPKLYKALGRKIKNYDEAIWQKKRVNFMYQINMLKFTQNKELGDKLKATGSKELVEASPYDCIWGCGLNYNDEKINDKTKWPGLNLLGQVLMKVRSAI